jgi:hypothetical protein
MTFSLAVLCGLAWSQTGLTTIQDTLFKADGTRFSGTLTIQWSTFDAINVGTVVQQSKNVQVTNGNLFVQLVPNAGALPPANIYTVQYQSGGSQQFSESWTVGVSATPLTVSEVRVGTLSVTNAAGAGPNSSGATTPIPESSVVGLVDDLSVRPTKGVAFGANGVAVVDDNGALETAVGQIGQCVLVDGTTGPCGGNAPTFVDAETPGGSLNGTNNTFTLANIPAGASLMLFRNGLYMTAGPDYTLTGSTLQFASNNIPQPLDTLTASYRVNPAVAGVIGNPEVGPVVPVAAAQVVCSAAGLTTAAGASTSVGACDVPAGGLQPGDRIEIRFSFAHSGMASGFDVLIDWGSTTIVSRHGGTQDAAFVGQAEAAITAAGAQLSVQSWGTVLSLLPAIVTSPVQSGVQISLHADVSTPGSDTVTLTNYTVLRYPSH